MTTPLKPCPDAVEAFAKHVFGGDTELIMQKARECVADLTAAGFTITRAAAPMTDAELEREAIENAFVVSVKFDNNDNPIKKYALHLNDAIALAKRFRG